MDKINEKLNTIIERVDAIGLEQESIYTLINQLKEDIKKIDRKCWCFSGEITECAGCEKKYYLIDINDIAI